MEAISGRPRARSAERAQGPIPYLVVALGWYALAMFALAVRVSSPLWRPVFEWVFSQALLFEKGLPIPSRTAALVAWLLVYVAIGLVAWRLVERNAPRARRHVWRRAFLTWLAIQLVYTVASAILVGKGVISE